MLFLLLVGCGSRYAGFESFDEKTHYKLKLLGEDELKIQPNDFLLISFKYCSSEKCDDSTAASLSVTSASLMSTFWSRFHLQDEFVLLLDAAPDSTWIDLLHLEHKNIKWPLIARINIQGLFTEGKYHGLEEGRESVLLLREERKMAAMRSKDQFTEKNGCYISITKLGQGDTLKIDDEILLSYKAYFSDGRKFDDTDNWKDSLRFKYGQPFQILKGIEEGIQGLTEGTEAKIIIPSHLAFGKLGSSTALVPPYEPLLYDLKIIAVNH
jgi:hypothetical protein